jgi:predicted translin family RNA/ssDNA-binding protein
MSRYVIANLDGASEEYAETREDAVQALREIAATSPDAIRELFVEEYDDAGALIGDAVPADKMLAATATAAPYTQWREVTFSP